MVAYVRAEVVYACELNEDQARQVVEYMAQNNCSAEYAVEMLYQNTDFELYDRCTESDFSTEGVEDVEFDEDDDELLAEYGLE